MVLLAVAWAFFAPAPAGADELLVNGGFESGTEGWAATFGSLDAPAEPTLEGVRAARLTSTALQSHEVFQFVNVANSQPYEFEGWALLDDPDINIVFLRISWFDGSGGLISTADSPWLTLPDAQFRRLSTGPVVSPLAAVTARVGIRVQGTGEFTLYLDEFSFSGAAPPQVTPPHSPPPATPTPVPSIAPTSTVAPTPSKTPVAEEPEMFDRLTNGGFEQLRPDGTPYGWRDVGAELGVTRDAPLEGAFALAVTSRTTSTKWAYQSVRIAPGAWYEAAAFARNVNAEEAFLRVSWYASPDASGASMESVDSVTSVGGGGGAFFRITTDSAQAPSGALSARVRLMLRPGTDAETLAYFDAVSFEVSQPDSDSGTGGVAGNATARPGGTAGGKPQLSETPPLIAAAPATPFRFANVRPATTVAPGPVAGGEGGLEWLAAMGIAIGGATIAVFAATEHRLRRRSE